MKNATEFGRLATTQDEMLYALINEQREANKLLYAILDKITPIIQPEPQKKEVKKDVK